MSEQKLGETLGKLDCAVCVMKLDAGNAILAWRDTGSFKGRSYDKYRVGTWYYSTRHDDWFQAQGSLSIAFERRFELLTALTGVAIHEGVIPAAPVSVGKPAKRKATA